MIPTIEIENFLNDPLSIRDMGIFTSNYLARSYKNDEMFSGYRSVIKDKKLNDEIYEKIQKNLKLEVVKMGTCFNLNPESSMFGVPHFDNYGETNKFAGVIYLNEEFPDNCGTTIYEEREPREIQNDIEHYKSKMAIVYNPLIDPNDPLKRKFAEEILNFKNNILTKKKCFEFKFNKLVLYSGNSLHSGDFYFGEHKEQCRMTIAVFGECRI